MQRGNRTGHCASCHETFEGLAVFDSHQSFTPEGFVICANPADVVFQKEPLRLENGTWRGKKFENVSEVFTKEAV